MEKVKITRELDPSLNLTNVKSEVVFGSDDPRTKGKALLQREGAAERSKPNAEGQSKEASAIILIN